MAVDGVCLKNITFLVEKSASVPTTTLDHVRRIRNDHDYTKITVPEDKNDSDMAILNGEYSNDLLNGQGAFEVLDGVCGNSNRKNENEEQLPKEGIEASDMSSLLEQFLEYEQDIRQSSSLLTPATSPGRCETLNELKVVTNMDPHKSTIEFTPSSTPPVLEPPEQKMVPMDCNTLLEKSAESQVVNSTLHNKRKLDNSEASCSGELHFSETKKGKFEPELKKCLTSENNKDSDGTLGTKIVKDDDCHDKLHESGHKDEGGKDGHLNTKKSPCESVQDDEILSSEVNKLCDKYRDKLLADVESRSNKISGKRNSLDAEHDNNLSEQCHHSIKNSNRRKSEYDTSENTRFKRSSHACEAERQEMKQSRRRCTDDESSDDDRYDPRECEQSNRRYRETSKYSHERERCRDHPRRHSAREHSEYDHNSNRRCHGDKRNDYRGQSYDKQVCKNVRDIEQERKIDFRLGRSTIKDVAKEERRVVYVGGLPYGTTRDELWEKLRRFGPVEKVTVHFREGERDNYGFVTFFEPEDARQCIEQGNSDPNEATLDLCFGGRRQYCGGSYVDFDSKTSHIEELSETFGNVRGNCPEEDDFDSLLRKCQEEIRSGK